jgi:DNA-binding NarL/FixJ family response regulator
MANIVILDDHKIVLSGLRVLFQSSGIATDVFTATTLAEAKSLCRLYAPDVLVMDLRVPDSRGVDEIPDLKREFEGMRILVLTGYGTKLQDQAREFGADGFLSKGTQPEDILAEIKRLCPALDANDGLLALSPRETQIADLIVQGRSNLEIAGELGLTLNTVKTYTKRILSKLGARDRVQVAVMWSSKRQGVQ